MGFMDAFTTDAPVTIKHAEYYELVKEAAKAELIMNAVNCNVPHSYIRQTMTGVAEEPPGFSMTTILNINHGTEENPNIKEELYSAEMDWSVANMEIARREAYGEPEIYDDGQPDPAEVPSQIDVIEAQVTYTAMITDTLLTEV